MGNYEIFSQTMDFCTIILTLLALIVAGICAMRENVLRKPLKFLLYGFILEFAAIYIEFLAVENQGQYTVWWVLFEMILFLLSMLFMSLAASVFVSFRTKKTTYWPVQIMSLVGLLSIILFTFIIQDGEMINELRIILPLASFAYLAVGFSSKIKLRFARGYKVAFVLSILAAIVIALKFFNIYTPWYVEAIFYSAFAFSFLLMESDELHQNINQLQQEVYRFNQRLEEIIKLSPFPIIISRLSDNKIILANDNAIRTFSIDPDNINRYNLHDFFADSHNKQALLEQLEERHEVQDFEVLIKTPKNDAPFWLLTSANIIDYNNDVAVYAAFQDITSRKVRENVLQNQAIRDPLTSLYNRRYFEEEVAKRILQAKADKKAYSILMLDADFFKKVNDTYGHKIGDKVLIELSAKTERALRDCDIVARYGGEEFLVFLPDITPNQAHKVADRLRLSIANIEVKTDTGQIVKFTVSIGVSSSEISDNVDVLIKTADAALYRAKQNGRNRVEVFRPEDLKEFSLQQGDITQDESRTIHPVFKSENNAEISLLDGADAGNLEE